MSVEKLQWSRNSDTSYTEYIDQLLSKEIKDFSFSKFRDRVVNGEIPICKELQPMINSNDGGKL